MHQRRNKNHTDDEGIRRIRGTDWDFVANEIRIAGRSRLPGLEGTSAGGSCSSWYLPISPRLERRSEGARTPKSFTLSMESLYREKSGWSSQAISRECG